MSLVDDGETKFGDRVANTFRRKPIVEQGAPSLIVSYGGEDYILRKKGTFSGRFTSEVRAVTICGEDYIQYSILCPVLEPRE